MCGNKVEIDIGPDSFLFKTRLRGASKGKQISVIEALRVWTRLWHWMDEELPVMPDTLKSTRPVRLTSEDGGNGSLHTTDVNPRFLATLMGWPSGWTDPAQPVTEFAVWQQRWRGALSKLTSKPIGRSDGVYAGQA